VPIKRTFQKGGAVTVYRGGIRVRGCTGGVSRVGIRIPQGSGKKQIIAANAVNAEKQKKNLLRGKRSVSKKSQKLFNEDQGAVGGAL